MAENRAGHPVLDISNLASRDPMKQFDVWYKEADSHPGVEEAPLMTISTATKDGRPSARIVSMDKYDDKGFYFNTNSTSRKAKQLRENPFVCMSFFWEAPHRVVRIEGKVYERNREECLVSFRSKPVAKQIGFMLHCEEVQSKVIKTREEYIDRNVQLRKKYLEAPEIPLPDQMTAFFLEPEMIEFYQGHDLYVNDRIIFRKPYHDGEEINPELTQKGKGDWLIERMWS